MRVSASVIGLGMPMRTASYILGKPHSQARAESQKPEVYQTRVRDGLSATESLGANGDNSYREDSNDEADFNHT